MTLDPRVWGAVFPELLGRTNRLGHRPILGFRTNYIAGLATGSGPALCLQSMRGTHQWQPGVNASRCLRGYDNSHQAPARGCTCGFHAWHDLRPLECLDELSASAYVMLRVILVGVAASGTVQIHRRGWRAQFARIVALCDEIPVSYGIEVRPYKLIDAGTAGSLSERYQVPVVALKDLCREMRSAGEFIWEKRNASWP